MKRHKKDSDKKDSADLMEVEDMETFGPIALDYFNGRRVEDVTPGGPNSAVWTIRYTGGGIICNFDPLVPMPTAIKGAAQTMLILGSHTDPGTRTPLTEIRYGLESVKLNPLQYAMYDPSLTKGKLVFAQRSHANMPSFLPPHPDERVAEGPTGEESDASS